MWFVISLLCIIFANCAEKEYNVNNKNYKQYLLLIGVVNVVFLGLRDIGVGRDTLAYINPYFQYASTLTNVDSFFHTPYDIVGSFDKGFLFLAYLSSLVGNDSRILLFITELFIMTFIVMGMYELKKTLNYSISFFYTFFVLLYLLETINLMRQFCAMSLLFYGYSLFLQKKWKAYLLCQIAAYFFHSTSVIFVVIPLGLVVSQMEKNYLLKKLYVLGVIFVGLFFVFSYNYFISIVENFGIFKESYFESYGANNQFSKAEGIGTTNLVSFIICITIYFICKKNQFFPNEILYIYIVLVLLNFIFQLASLIIIYYFRIAYYFGLILSVYLSLMLKKHNFTLKMSGYVYIVVFALYFMKVLYVSYYTKVDNQYNRYNLIYKSQVLGIDES